MLCPLLYVLFNPFIILLIISLKEVTGVDKVLGAKIFSEALFITVKIYTVSNNRYLITVSNNR